MKAATSSCWSIAPLAVVGGTGSPANPLAVF